MKDNSNITPELLETVERYYNTTMAPEERDLFKKKLDADPAFKYLVEDIRQTLSGIETQVLKEHLNEFHKEIPETESSSTTPKKKPHFNFSRIAMAAVILITIGLFWFYGGESNRKIYDSYFKPDPGLPTTMSASDNFVFYDAMVNYKQGDYMTAIAKWEKLEQKSPDNDTLTYFLGAAHLANKNTDKATFYLNKTIGHSESVFREDAYYYLGWAYLKSDQIEDAISAFKKSNSENSMEILKKLQK